MTKREIASLAIKLMGVFILLKSIAYVPMAFWATLSTMPSEAEWLFRISMVMMSVVAAVIPLAWSLLIIFFSDKAAAWLIKKDNSIENASTTISKDDVMVMAVSCIGLYFIVASVPQLIHALMNNAAYMSRHIGRSFVDPAGLMSFFRNLIAPAVQIAIGVWLFAGSKGIVKLWKKIRS